MSDTTHDILWAVSVKAMKATKPLAFAQYSQLFSWKSSAKQFTSTTVGPCMLTKRYVQSAQTFIVNVTYLNYDKRCIET